MVLGAMMACASVSSFAQEGDLLTVLPQPTQTINMTVGTSTTVAVKRPFKTIHIIDPSVVDARAETDQRFTLLPKSAGQTTINILDENSNQIASVGIVVASNLRVTEELARETYENVPGRVRVHANGKSLAGVTFYRCNRDNCEFVEELVPRIPAQDQTPVANAPPAKTQIKASAQ